MSVVVIHYFALAMGVKSVLSKPLAKRVVECSSGGMMFNSLTSSAGSDGYWHRGKTPLWARSSIKAIAAQSKTPARRCPSGDHEALKPVEQI